MILTFAIFFDNIFGDKNIYHPVIFIGKLINLYKKIFFTDINSFPKGLVVCALTLITTGLFVFLILYIFNFNIIIQIFLIYSALAWRDLKDETEKIFSSLINKDIKNARKFLSYVVGRDTENLNENEIIRATIETISENSIDAIISVIFYAGLGFFLGENLGMCLSVWIFKAASTLDSMLGYESFGKFGTASARLDDILNFIPARIGGLIIIFSGFLMGENIKRSLKVFLTDRKKHKSPNSAHGESAFAGVLNIKLGGKAFYNGVLKIRPLINSEAPEPKIYDIVRAWKLLDISCSLFSVLIILITWKI